MSTPNANVIPQATWAALLNSRNGSASAMRRHRRGFALQNKGLNEKCLTPPAAPAPKLRLASAAEQHTHTSRARNTASGPRTQASKQQPTPPGDLPKTRRRSLFPRHASRITHTGQQRGRGIHVKGHLTTSQIVHQAHRGQKGRGEGGGAVRSRRRRPRRVRRRGGTASRGAAGAPGRRGPSPAFRGWPRRGDVPRGARGGV